MRVLVTGGSGFIGSRLIEMMIERGFNVKVLLRKTSSSKNLLGLKFESVEGDLREEASLKSAVSNVDYVVHLAGVVQGRSKDYFFENNSRGTENLAHAFLKYNSQIKRFVYISSLAAGGPSENLLYKKEDDLDQPVSFYGESKLQGEKALEKISHKFPVTILRPPVVYGPKDQGVYQFILPLKYHLNFYLRAHSAANKSKKYSVIYVDDLCEGIIKAVIESKGDFKKYYINDGFISYPFQEIIQQAKKNLKVKALPIPVPYLGLTLLAKTFELSSKVIPHSIALNKDKIKELIPDNWTCTSERIKEELNFHPEFNLEKGMKNTIQWYIQNQWL